MAALAQEQQYHEMNITPFFECAVWSAACVSRGKITPRSPPPPPKREGEAQKFPAVFQLDFSVSRVQCVASSGSLNHLVMVGHQEERGQRG